MDVNRIEEALDKAPAMPLVVNEPMPMAARQQVVQFALSIADNGVGLPEGLDWPKRGKLSALIVQSLRENAKAQVQVTSVPGQGMRVTLIFTRAAAAPQTA